MGSVGVVGLFWVVSFSLPDTSAVSQPHPLLGMASVLAVSHSLVLSGRPFPLQLLPLECLVGVAHRPGPAGVY